MDLIGLREALEKFNSETLPKLEELMNRDLQKLIDETNALLDRLDGTVIKVTVSIPPRGSLKG